jgi:hypothetical protein
MIEAALEPVRYWRPFPWSTTKVRISNDARKCVVFLGDCDTLGTPEKFEPFATAFLMRPNAPLPLAYLVTARHCVQDRNPFWVRLNGETGSQLILIEDPDWTFHEDPTVDVAVMEFPPLGEGRYSAFSSAWFSGRHVHGSKWQAELHFGPGDLTYTVGLFSYHRGESRNIPLVHTGHIAAFYEDEKIQVRDWSDRSNSPKFLRIDAYVVQRATLPGASGSPVFVRQTQIAAGEKHFHTERGAQHQWQSDVPTAYGELYLLGLWHGSWEIDDVKRAGAVVRNPAGYGIVVPANKIMEVFGVPKLKDRMEKAMAERKAARAKTLPVADSLPRKIVQKRFDATLSRMLETPPDPKKVSGK